MGIGWRVLRRTLEPVPREGSGDQAMALDGALSTAETTPDYAFRRPVGRLK